MTPDDRIFLRNFFRRVSDRAIGPDSPLYIPFYENPELTGDDPVELMARAIEWTPGQSVQLLSGYRGTGKSSELRRLEHRLRDEGYLVVRCDIEDYLNLSVPVDISDFLMAISGAFSDAIERIGFPGEPPRFWDSLVKLLKRIEFNGISTTLRAGGVSATIKANLKSDPSFKARLQEHMAGHLGSLVSEVHGFFEDCVRALKDGNRNDQETVFLVDSIEHFRGTLVNAREVQSSVETLFVSHAERLHLPSLHVVYTVPPYLKVRYSNVGSLYEPGGLHVLPALKLKNQDGADLPEGYDAMERVVEARGDWRKLLGKRSALDRLVRFSGGHLRDLLRLVAEVIRRATKLPVAEDTVDAAINQLRSEFLPIADSDARWLAKIARSHRTALENTEDLPDLARFFDTHLALCSRNGDEWYDVHPLISDHVASHGEKDRPGI